MRTLETFAFWRTLETDINSIFQLHFGTRRESLGWGGEGIVSLRTIEDHQRKSGGEWVTFDVR